MVAASGLAWRALSHRPRLAGYGWCERPQAIALEVRRQDARRRRSQNKPRPTRPFSKENDHATPSRSSKREILPDPKFKSTEIAKFVNVLMKSGKKSVAEQIIYRALDQISKKSGKDALEVFNTAVNAVKPMVEVKSRRVGGANYQVPVEVRPVRRVALSMRWIRSCPQARRKVDGCPFGR